MGNKTPSDPFDPTQPFDPEQTPGAVPDFDEGTAAFVEKRKPNFKAK